jgi:hypothetical protein
LGSVIKIDQLRVAEAIFRNNLQGGKKLKYPDWDSWKIV